MTKYIFNIYIYIHIRTLLCSRRLYTLPPCLVMMFPRSGSVVNGRLRPVASCQRCPAQLHRWAAERQLLRRRDGNHISILSVLSVLIKSRRIWKVLLATSPPVAEPHFLRAVCYACSFSNKNPYTFWHQLVGNWIGIRLAWKEFPSLKCAFQPSKDT